jgi:hypothetical protein
MTPEEIRDEARDALRNETISVDFTVTCEEFRVPAMYGLEFSATYECFGDVTPDRSGDHVTPNGPPEVMAYLQDVKEYTISLDGCELPKWLQEHLAIEFASEMDAAFLEAIGGQAKLDELAIEHAL